MVVGFALAAMLFGVILDSDGTDSISSGGESELVTIDQESGADPNSPATVETESVEGPATMNSDGSDALGVTPQEAEDGAMGDSTPMTMATAVPPTTAASTTAPPATATTVAPTSTAGSTAMTSVTTMDTVAGAPPGPGPSGGDAAIQQQVLDLTNAERAKAGCQAVILDPILSGVADGHSEDMAANSYFDHTGRDGSKPWDRVAAAGYPARASGENIAQGYPDPAAVVAGWMSSPGHRQNMLDCGWTELGVGYAEGSPSGGNIRPLYWTQVFATRR
jgi:uncharacterized protein YkwD